MSRGTRDKCTPWDIYVFPTWFDCSLQWQRGETRESLRSISLERQPMTWSGKGGHRSLGLIVPDGRHPGQQWDYFPWLGQSALGACAVLVCERDGKPGRAGAWVEASACSPPTCSLFLCSCHQMSRPVSITLSPPHLTPPPSQQQLQGSFH